MNNESIQRTRFFSNCWGVFEGGGVRGAALAGAYQAATEAGIRFNRVAGTSAGSIVAALVAAGGKPDFISNKLMSKDFLELVKPSTLKQSIFENKVLFFRLLQPFTFGLPRKFVDLILYSGLYSSENIEYWVESLLKEIVLAYEPDVQRRPVTFRDLRLPLHIVASDLTQTRPKVWSKEDTPQESVAFAVRCSCTIPFYFQAIKYGSSVFVDGGALSNLPAFVFQNIPNTEARSVLSKIICFRMLESPNATVNNISSIIDLGSALSSTIVSGATTIQLSLQSQVYTVDIDTGSIKATDFSKVKKQEKQKLYDSGYQAVRRFIKNERMYIRTDSLPKVYRGFDENLLLLIQALPECFNSLWVCGNPTNTVNAPTYWVYYSFLSLLFAARRGIKLTVVTQPVDSLDSSKQFAERYRRWLLKQLGVRIIINPSSPFNGFLIDPSQPTSLAIISSDQDKEFENEYIRLYKKEFDAPVIESLWKPIESLTYENSSFSSASNLSLLPCSIEEVSTRIKKVPQYKNANFTFADVFVDESLMTLQHYVKEYKLVQIHQLICEFKNSGIELFYPLKVTFNDGTFSIVTPPVFERVDNKLILIEGNTRIFYCLQNRQYHIKAIIMENVEAELPGEPILISKIQLTSATTTLNKLTPNINRALYRQIEEQIHDASWNGSD
ncbi:patatin-like phospholipase family protein (plasmid) [Kovacikia minuta CCNUW1]|uniref:patatin-like phospholipase family protein n=1 Tax=Kovacikia minuta TaxID=2931930 RepID=UPI001CC920E7|nr:patatin-like phospholipase family protein [Kovacikia minuta]UBF30650.1 patatin-like phospholipase family protein [Kovacikia minuta CCNUW1]